MNIIRENDGSHVEQLIRYALDKIGLTVSYSGYAVDYDPDTHRATVMLENDHIALENLIRLNETGLGQDFVVEWGSSALTISFNVSDNLASATIVD